MAKRMTKEEKALDEAYYETYSRLGKGVRVDVFDIGPMHRDAIAAVKGGATMEEAVKAVIAKYRKD